nr:MAG TPA: hypothetical protein [Caudoviricetes sp.]
MHPLFSLCHLTKTLASFYSIQPYIFCAHALQPSLQYCLRNLFWFLCRHLINQLYLFLNLDLTQAFLQDQ